ncbi:MAG: hypothetical protein AAFU73_16330 [Planctomycetota bacterium]
MQPVPIQEIIPGPEIVFERTSYGTNSSSSGGLSELREDAREDTGIVGEALFPRGTTTVVALVLAVAWFGFVRPRLKRRRG